MRLDSNIKEIKGIGEKSAATFAKAGMFTVNDVVRYFPRGYEEFGAPVSFDQLQDEEIQSVAAFLYTALISSTVISAFSSALSSPRTYPTCCPRPKSLPIPTLILA